MVALRAMVSCAIKIGVCALMFMVGLGGVAHARSISGRVTDQDTGEPVVGATVTASSGAASYSDSAPTDDGGYYTVHGLPPALDFIVSASASGYLTEYYYEVTSFGDAALVDVSTYDAAGIDFTLSPAPPPAPRTISGRVVFEGTSNGISGVPVVAYDGYEYVLGDGYLGEAETDANGYYTISGLDNTETCVGVWTSSPYYVNKIYDDCPFPGANPPRDTRWYHSRASTRRRAETGCGDRCVELASIEGNSYHQT